MRHPSTDDKIVIRVEGDGHWTYFSVRDARDNGTIIDFLQRGSGVDPIWWTPTLSEKGVDPVSHVQAGREEADPAAPLTGVQADAVRLVRKGGRKVPELAWDLVSLTAWCGPGYARLRWTPAGGRRGR